MTLYGSLQLSHGLGLCRNQPLGCCYKPAKVPMSKKLHLSSGALFLQHNYLRKKPLLEYIHRPIRYRTTGFRCNSFIETGKVIEPAVKAATFALSKSCNVIQQYPIVYKLVPALSLLIFSVWGLVPLVRQGRNFLLHKNDNGWKKSGTYHVMTSYVQPLLLWLGTIYICRALDPVVLPTEASEIVKSRLLNFVRSLSTVLAFAYCLSSLIQQTQKLFSETSDPNDSRNIMGFQFAGKAVYSAVWVAAVSLFMELLGFSTQKWLTAGGLGTVLITLAGREILTNFLSSVMIHATRPFVPNEWIQTKIGGYEISGTVEHVGWWSPTIIRGEDREAIHIPNHKFTVNVVRNLTQKTHWRIKTHLAISHLDVSKINNIVADMRKVLAKNPHVEQQRLHRRVFLDNVNPENQALRILISCFVKTSHYEEYLCVKEAVLLDLLRVISHHRARLATPIRTIRRMYTDADIETAPFGDSIYDHSSGVASRRPLMLIEPSYKINGEERPKPQTKTSKAATGDQETKNSLGSKKGGESLVSDTNKVTDELGPKPPLKSGLKPPLEAEKQMAKSNASTSRTALEDNIVLGVALEGSKRTLPIEEEDSAIETDTKELTGAHRTSSRSSMAEKEKKDSQIQPEQ